jgi:hypothetical protein
MARACPGHPRLACLTIMPFGLEATRAGIPALSPTSIVTAAPVAAAPVTTAPAPMAATPAPMTAAPAPMTAAPAPATTAAPAPTTTAPAHLFRLQMFHLVAGGNSGTGTLVRGRQPSVLCERMRHQRCCPCTGGECGGACSKSKGQFQKVAAFHDIFLSVRASDAERVSPRRDERSVNRESQLQRAITPPGRHRGVTNFLTPR